MSSLWDWEVPVWLVGWLLVYAIHGTLWLGLLWLIGPTLRRVPDAVQEGLWRLGVLGTLLTATLQMTLVSEPLGGHLASLAGSETVLAETGSATGSSLGDEPEADPIAEQISEPLAAAAPPASPEPSWGHVLVLLVATLTLFSLHQRWQALSQLRRLLRRRKPLENVELRLQLAGLAARAGYHGHIRLSACHGLGTPIAFGVLRPEVCLPMGIWERLGSAQRAAMLGHELGHLKRRDPLSLLLLGLLVSVFRWQPFLIVARDRLQQLAEYRCDAFAARMAGPLPVARCLLEVADWMAHPAPARPSLAWGMAANGSLLKQRVDRLLAGDVRDVAWKRGPSALLTVLLLAGMTLGLPGVRVEPSPTAEPAPAPPPRHAPALDTSGVSPVVRALAESLDQEWDALKREVSLLRARFDAASRDPELEELLDLLDLRLRALEARRSRIQSLLTLASSAPSGPGAPTGDSR